MAIADSNEIFDLVQALVALSARNPIVYCPNPGNWGAALTREATKQIFSRYSIPYREFRGIRIGTAIWNGVILRRALVYGGGGAWSQEYNGGAMLVKRAARYYPRLLVLPSSFGSNLNIPNCSFWRRDRNTSKRNVPESRFCHDLGFFYHLEHSYGTGVGVGRFLRTDKISALGGTNPLSGSRDVSLDGDEYSPLDGLLSEIGKYEEIHTDRVHVAIAACLLKKRLHLYATSTPLLKDLYAASIVGRYSQVEFHDS